MKKLQRSLTVLAATLLLLAVVFVSVSAGRQMGDSLTEQRSEVDRQVARSIVAVTQRALAYGIPFDRLVDAPRYLDSVKHDNRGMQYLIISNMDGRIVYSTDLSGLNEREQLEQSIAAWGANAPPTIGNYMNFAAPISFKERQVGWLHIGEPGNMVQELLREIAYDVMTVMIVATMVSFGLMRLLLAMSVSIPMRATRELLASVAAADFRRYLPHDVFNGIGELSERIDRIVADVNDKAERLRKQGITLPGGYQFHLQGQRDTVRISAIDYIQWPFFLLIFADSMSLSFFPFFVGQFYDESSGVPKAILVGLPISIFMLVWAISMPWAGMWCDRVGYQRAFALGAGITTAGLVLTAFATSIVEIVVWRSVTAVGYGVVFVTAQAYISANTATAERTRGMALFLTSFFAGSLSGAAIGGILVDRLGYRFTFLVSAVLGAAATAFVIRFVRRGVGQTSRRKTLNVADFLQLLKNRQFSAITFLAAVPAKIVLTGFLYYSVPLYLNALGSDQSSTGRIMMAYGLAIILLSPTIAGWADRLGHRRWFVVAGGYVAAVGVATLCFIDSTAGVALSVTLIGIAHAVGVPPQLALVSDSCQELVQDVSQATSAGIFRLIERLGNVMGPLVFGALISFYEFKTAFGGVAVLMFVTTTSFALLLLFYDRGETRGRS